MKTAISLPDDVFRALDDYAKRHRLTRSGVLTAAARQYLARQVLPESATEAWDRAIESSEQRLVRTLPVAVMDEVDEGLRWFLALDRP